MHSGSAIDVLQFGERIGCAMQVDGVFARRPELKRSVKHLATTSKTGPKDHTNTATWLLTEDGGEDRNRVDVSNVNLPNVFFGGRRAASIALGAAGFTASELDFDAIFKSDENIDLLRPRGEWIGVSKTDDAALMDAGADANAPVDAAGAPVDGAAGTGVGGVGAGVGGVGVGHEEEDACALLEETLPPLPETQDGRRPTLRRITLCGDVNEVTIASALRIKMRANQQGSLESGRIARYRDQMKAGQVINKEEVAAAEAQLHAGEDTLLALVSTSRGVTVAVLLPTKFAVAGEVAKACIGVEQFNAKGVMVSGAVVKVLVPAASSDELSWLVGGAVGETLEVAAAHTCLINPTLVVEDTAAADEPRQTQLRCSLLLNDFRDAGSLLYETWHAVPPEGRAPLASARSASETLPYLVRK